MEIYKNLKIRELQRMRKRRYIMLRNLSAAMLWTIICLPASVLAQQDLLIFGGPDNDEYLGCLVCNEFSSESICNGFGQYGNEFSSKGMFNEFSRFGNELSSSSPWNEFSSSTSVPVVVDRDGGFHGYFTINEFRSDAVDFADELKEIYEESEGDLEEVRVRLCESLGYSG